MRKSCLMALLAITAIVFTTINVGAENIPASEYEQYTHTIVSPFLSNYHLTTPQQIANGYRGGEGGQLVYSLAVSSGNTDFMLMGNDTVGVYYSQSGGREWHMAQSGIGDAVNGVEFYPGNDNVAFAFCAGFIYTSGIYRSEDSGKTWERVQPVASGKNVQNNFKFGKINDNGYYSIYTSCTNCPVASYRDDGYTGVFKSDDMGKTWHSIGLSQFDVWDLWADRDSDTIVAACDGGGITVSYNGGETWVEKNDGLPEINGAVRSTAIAVDTRNKNHWIAAMGTRGGAHRELYETTDAGTSWSEVTSVYEEIQPHENSSVQLLDFTYPDENGNVKLMLELFCSQYPFRISSDDGRTFSTMKFSSENAVSDATGWYPEGFAVTDADHSLVMSAHGLIARSDDGGNQFRFCNSGISGAGGLDFAFDDDGNLDFIGVFDFGLIQRIKGYDGLYPPMKIDTDYPSINGSKTNSSIIKDPNDKNHYFAYTGSNKYGKYGTIVETFDGFKTYRYYEGMLEYLKQMSERKGLLCIQIDLFRSKQDDNLIYSTWFVSEDNGVTWRESFRPISAVSPFDGDVVYSVTEQTGNDIKPYEIHVSYDRGNTWQNTGFKIQGGAFIMADAAEDRVIWVMCRGASTVARIDLKTGKMRAFGEPNGIVADSGTKDLQMSGLIQDPNNPMHLLINARDYYYSRRYLYETYDGGEKWERVPIPNNLAPSSMKFHPTEPRIYIGSMSGIYIYEFAKRKKIETDCFLDIDNSFAREEIKYMALKGIISGYEDGNFLPDASLSRAELAKLVCGVKELEVLSATETFTDITPSDWSYHYAAAVVGANMMAKEQDGSFHPEKAVTLGEFKSVASAMTDNAADFGFLTSEDDNDMREVSRGEVCCVCAKYLKSIQTEEE